VAEEAVAKEKEKGAGVLAPEKKRRSNTRRADGGATGKGVAEEEGTGVLAPKREEG
jgi:hypothetical protein